MLDKYKSKCALCNNAHFKFNMLKMNEGFICQNCQLRCKKYNKGNFNDYNIIDLKLSLEQQKSVKELKRQQLREEKQQEFIDTLNEIKFLKPNVSNIEVKKRFLKDMPTYSISSVRKTIPDCKLNNFIVIDTETTGLSPAQHEILEISAIKFIDGNPVECMTTLLKPKQPIPEHITEINHISNEMVKDAPNIEYVIENFSNFIKGFNIVGYNLDFDLEFLYVSGLDFFSEKRQFFDALQLCRRCIPKLFVNNYKLDTMCEYGKIYRPHAHRATEDALATGIIFRDVGTLLKKGI